MKDELISLFIDDELDLDEKIVFVETVHTNPVFTEETLDLLKQEKLLATPLSINRPMPRMFSFKRLWSFHIPFKALAAVVATAMIIMFIVWPETRPQKELLRLVIVDPGVEQSEIDGSFTRRKPLPVIFTDRSGYWKDSIRLFTGENEYSNFLDWKMCATNSSAQFRKELTFQSSELTQISMN